MLGSTTFVGLEQVTPKSFAVPLKIYDHTRYIAVQGQEYYKPDIGLCLPTGGHYESPSYDGSVLTDGGYRSRFGPCVEFPWMVHANNNHSLNTAFNNRILLVRDNENQLRANQATYLAQRREPRVIYQQAFLVGLNDHPDEIEDIIAHINDPHPKRQLRIDALKDLLAIGDIGAESWLRGGSAKAVLKKDELSKTSKGLPKPGRIVCDLGVTASLRGFRLTKYLKHVMTESIVTSSGDEYQFCIKPDVDTLTEVFAKLINPPHRSYFVYFSDDSCYSVRDAEGVVHIYNVDISKCDISHTPSLFEELLHLTPPQAQETMEKLIDQCRADLVIQSPEDKSIRLRLRSAGNEPHLLSGSTLTTLINNLACTTVGECLNSCTDYTLIGGEPVAMIAAVAECGYDVTMEKCERPEDIQFLKNSPILTTSDEYRPMLNLGVLLRATGICRGDLPGRGDINQRAAYFQQQLLKEIGRAHV